MANPIVFSDMVRVVDFIESMSLSNMMVSVDGMTGCRKSTLSRWICDEFNLDWFEMDSYVVRPYERGMPYPDILCLERLMSECYAALESGDGFVIDGICALEIFSRLGVEPNVRVYVDRCDVSTKLHESRMTSRLERLPTDSEIPLHVAISLYHKKYMPRTCSDVVYVWENIDVRII